MGLMRQTKLGRVCKNGNDAPADAVKPFDASHAGLATAEGGSLIILEDLDRAKSRGVRIYAEVVGFAAACDPNGVDIARPTAGNLGLAVRNAIKNAGITPDDVDMIVAYGTAVPGEDAAEAAEWKKALGDKLASIPAVSFTSLTGTMFAGGGSCQLALAAKAVEQQIVPPTINFEKPASGCELNLSATARKKEIRYAVVGAFTVGGQSGAVVLKKSE
jgi:3-oxoacyl-[acyl-carrier-protein] synthase II